MDKSDPDIVFDDKGVCNHCHQAQKSLKENKKKKKHDCLMGLSGGVDSSTTLHYLVHAGFNPLCFTLDNGYNDPRADENVRKMVRKLGLDHEIVRIDQAKYRDLQKAFIQSGVPNIEIPTDHILMAITYEMAAKHGIKKIYSGGNIATESIMPATWSYPARDLVHIKDVYKRVIGKELTGLPVCSLLKWNYYKWIKRIKICYLLDNFDYNREESEQMLMREYDFESTGEKHEENVFTKWFQSFYLFEKFGIDKRKAHYSSLINSGQMTRSEALEKLKRCPEYPELGIEHQTMRYGRHHHEYFKTDKNYDRISKICRKIGNAVGRNR